jgi:hypothetical protein
MNGQTPDTSSSDAAALAAHAQFNREQFGEERGGVEQEEQGQVERRPVNLDELEEFKAYKAQVNKTIAERDRAAREAERRFQQELEESRRRTAALEQDMESRIVANMDEFGQMEYRTQQEARKRQEAERRLAEYESMQSRAEFMRVLREQYGVEPSDDSHPVMALRSVTDELLRQNAEKDAELARYRKESEARKAALEDAPDLGIGVPNTPKSDLQRSYDLAMIELRGSDADRISRQAANAGVAIDRLAWLKMRKQ